MTTRSLRKLPSHCVLVANHANCSQHDQPVLESKMRNVYNGLADLITLISNGFDEYKIEEILSFDQLCPDVSVFEYYGNHCVSKLEVVFDDADNGWFLGPWTKDSKYAPFKDREGNDVDESYIETSIGLWIKNKFDENLKYIEKGKQGYLSHDRSSYTTDISLAEGSLNVYKQDYKDGVLSMDSSDLMRIACKSTCMYGVVIGDHDAYTDEFWLRINEHYGDTRPSLVCKNYFLFDKREDAEKLFSIMDRFFEKRIHSVLIGEDGSIEDENC